MQQDLAQCKAKLAQLSIRDMSKVLVINKTSVYKNDVKLLNDLIEKYDFEEDKEKENIRQELRLMKSEVGKLMKELKSYSNSQEYLNKISTLCNNIQLEQNEFRAEMGLQFQELEMEEDQLEEELQQFEQRLDNFDQKVVIKQQKRQNINIQQQDQSELGQLKYQIECIDIEIKNIKMLDNEDQTQFLKVRTKHKGKHTQQFINDCLRAIPFLTEEQLLQQCENYNKYLKLEDEKKQLMQEYKVKKEEAKQQKLQDEAPPLQPLKKQKSLVPLEEREKLKEEIKQWKMKRTATKAVDEVQKQTNCEIERLKRDKERMERELKKQQVIQFREQKLVEQQREQELKQMETMARRFVSQEAKERIRTKENTMLEKKLNQLQQKQQKKIVEQMKEQNRQEDKYIKFAYVESKVNETTKAAEQQKRQKFDPKIDQGKYANTFGGNLLGQGRRAQPQWRQNL